MSPCVFWVHFSVLRFQGLRPLGADDAIFAVQGFGGMRPLVAETDLENQRKNRRVDFYLEKSK